jgi:hypothetical protein
MAHLVPCCPGRLMSPLMSGVGVWFGSRHYVRWLSEDQVDAFRDTSTIEHDLELVTTHALAYLPNSSLDLLTDPIGDEVPGELGEVEYGEGGGTDDGRHRTGSLIRCSANGG